MEDDSLTDGSPVGRPSGGEEMEANDECQAEK